MNERTKILTKKISYFKKNKIPVHIQKESGIFHNGLILEFSRDLIIIDDEVVGATPIYFLEIKFIEKRQPPKK